MTDITYSELKQFSVEISLDISNKLNLGKKYLHPPDFNVNIRYYLMGFNPSSANPERFLTNDSIGFQTLENAKNCKKLLTESARNELAIYEKYYKKPYLLIKSIDPTIKIFWRYKPRFDLIFKKFGDKYSNIFSCLKQAGVIDGTDRDNYLLFGDLIYVMDKKQSKITLFLEKNPEYKEKISKLFKLQLQYYKPEIVLIINTYASKLVLEQVYNHSLKSDTVVTSIYDEEENVHIVFSPMLSGQRAADVFSVARLRKELREIVFKKDSN